MVIQYFLFTKTQNIRGKSFLKTHSMKGTATKQNKLSVVCGCNKS